MSNYEYPHTGGGRTGPSAYEVYVEVQLAASLTVLSKAAWVASLVPWVFDPANPDYSALTTYPARSVVRFVGSLWLARSQTIGVTPGSNGLIWQELVEGIDLALYTVLLAAAETARAAAETAASAALVSAVVYDTVIAGLAAVGEGGVFKVAEDDSLSLYTDTGGTAVLRGQIPMVTSLAESRTPFPLRIVDDNLGTMVAIDSDGQLRLATPRGLWPMPAPDMANPLADVGWPTFLGATGGYRLSTDYDTTLWIVPFLGQSLAGGANDNDADTIFSTTPTHAGRALMPLPGAKPDGEMFDRFRDLIEEDGTGFDTNRESPCSAMVNGIITKCNTLFGVKPRIATFMASRGARNWDELCPGQDAWHIFVKALAGCVRAARANGWRPVVPAIFYLQGEQDRVEGLNESTIRANRRNLVREVRRAVRQLTHQAEDPVVFISQPNNAVATDGTIPAHMMAPLSLDGQENIRVLPPHYPLAMSVGGTGVHPSSAAYVVMGNLLAEVFMREVLGPGHTPTRVERVEWNSATEIDLTYSLATLPLILDLTGAVVTVPSWTGGLNGFQFFDGSGVPPTIASMAIRADGNLAGSPLQVLRITLSGASSGPAPRLHYATRNDGTGANSGNVNGARGCIRDSSAAPFWAQSEVIYLRRQP